MRPISPWLHAVLADFVGTPVDDADVRLVDLDPAGRGDPADVIPDIETWVTPSKPNAHRILLKVAGNVRSVEYLIDNPPVLAVEIASTLQEFVMDETGGPWPEVTVDGRQVVLDPRVSPDGTPSWEGRGVNPCPFGEVASRIG
jgi:hypothetical protein